MNFPGSGGGRPGVDPGDPNVKRMQELMESCYAKTAMSGVAGFALGGVFGLFMASMAYDTPFHTSTPTPAAGAAAAAGKAAGTAAATAAGTAAAATAQTAGKASGAAATTTVAATASTTAAAATAPKPITSALATPAPAPAAPLKPILPAPAAVATGGGAATASFLTPPSYTSLPLRQQLAHGFRDMGTRSFSTAKNFGTVGALFSGIECGIEGLRAKNDMANGVAAGCVTGAILARNAGPQAAAIGCAGFAAFSAAIDAYLRMPPSDD